MGVFRRKAQSPFSTRRDGQERPGAVDAAGHFGNRDVLRIELQDEKERERLQSESKWGATRVRGESWYELVSWGGRSVDGCHGMLSRFKGRPTIGMNDK